MVRAKAGAAQEPAIVEVWFAELARVRHDLPDCWRLLAPSERQRAEGMADDESRVRYVAGRGLLRRLLAEKLDEDPAAIQFTYGGSGKPGLAGAPGPGAAAPCLAFNLSHAHERIAIAVSQRTGAPLEIGVDIEWAARRRRFDALVARYATACEKAAWERIDPGRRQVAFYRWWTRKEALVKAAGLGLARGLSRASVPVDEAPLFKVVFSEALLSPASSLPDRWLIATWELDPSLDAKYVLSVAAGIDSADPTLGPLVGSAQPEPHLALPLTRGLVLHLPGNAGRV